MAHAAGTSDLSVSSLFDFRNHVALVTGGATGLGEMAAQAFVQNGARVFIASRKESELKATSERLNKLGPGRCEFVVADCKWYHLLRGRKISKNYPEKKTRRQHNVMRIPRLTFSFVILV